MLVQSEIDEWFSICNMFVWNGNKINLCKIYQKNWFYIFKRCNKQIRLAPNIYKTPLKFVNSIHFNKSVGGRVGGYSITAYYTALITVKWNNWNLIPQRNGSLLRRWYIHGERVGAERTGQRHALPGEYLRVPRPAGQATPHAANISQNGMMPIWFFLFSTQAFYLIPFRLAGRKCT